MKNPIKNFNYSPSPSPSATRSLENAKVVRVEYKRLVSGAGATGDDFPIVSVGSTEVDRVGGIVSVEWEGEAPLRSRSTILDSGESTVLLHECTFEDKMR